MTLPKTITLRLTKRALDAVPAGLISHKDYLDARKCLICQAVRLRFPDVDRVQVYPGWVRIDDVVFGYSRNQHENSIIEAHQNPDKFKPFSIKLTREDA